MSNENVNSKKENVANNESDENQITEQTTDQTTTSVNQAGNVSTSCVIKYETISSTTNESSTSNSTRIQQNVTNTSPQNNEQNQVKR